MPERKPAHEVVMELLENEMERRKKGIPYDEFNIFSQGRVSALLQVLQELSVPEEARVSVIMSLKAFPKITGQIEKVTLDIINNLSK